MNILTMEEHYPPHFDLGRLKNLSSLKVLTLSDSRVTVSDGKATNWANLTPNSYGWEQSDPVKQPTFNSNGGLNGLPYLTGDGTNGYMNLGAGGPAIANAVARIDLFCIFRVGTLTTDRLISLYKGTDNERRCAMSHTSTQLFATTARLDAHTAASHIPNFVLETGKWYLRRIKADYANDLVEQWINGISLGTSTSAIFDAGNTDSTDCSNIRIFGSGATASPVGQFAGDICASAIAINCNDAESRLIEMQLNFWAGRAFF